MICRTMHRHYPLGWKQIIQNCKHCFLIFASICSATYQNNFLLKIYCNHSVTSYLIGSRYCLKRWTVDYSEINDDYLIKQYEIMSNKTYNFKKLLLSSYNPEIQREIITVSNEMMKYEPAKKL